MLCKSCNSEMTLRRKTPYCPTCCHKGRRNGGIASRKARLKREGILLPGRGPRSGMLFASTPVREYAMDVLERKAREPLFAAARAGDVRALLTLKHRYRLRLPMVEAGLRPEDRAKLERRAETPLEQVRLLEECRREAASGPRGAMVVWDESPAGLPRAT